MHQHLGQTHSRSNTHKHTCEAALCGLCQFWPAVPSPLHMYEGRDRTEHNQWACHCSSLPQKQLTHLYLTDESWYTQKEGSWILSKAIFNIFVSLFLWNVNRAGHVAYYFRNTISCCICVTHFICMKDLIEETTVAYKLHLVLGQMKWFTLN